MQESPLLGAGAAPQGPARTRGLGSQSLRKNIGGGLSEGTCCNTHKTDFQLEHFVCSAVLLIQPYTYYVIYIYIYIYVYIYI